MSLTGHDQVRVHEQSARTDKKVKIVAEKQYQITTADGDGRKIFTAVEDLDCCCRQCACVCRRDFFLRVRQNGDEVYKMKHGRQCCSWFSCCSCCRHRLDIKRQNGTRVGAVDADCKCLTCYPSFTVKNADGDKIYRVSKDIDCCRACCNGCKCCCCRCVVPEGYTIKGKGGEGSITKLNNGRDDDDVFALKFPKEADEDSRVLLLAANFLVDYALYDAPGKPDPQSMV